MPNAIRFDDTLDDAYVEFDPGSQFPLYGEIGVYLPTLALNTSPASDENFPTVFRVVSNQFGHSGDVLRYYPETDDFINWDQWFTGQGFLSIAPTPDAVQVVKGFWDTPGYADVGGTSLSFGGHAWTIGAVKAGLMGGEACGVIYITYFNLGTGDGLSDILAFDAATAPDLSPFTLVYGDVTLAPLPGGGSTNLIGFGLIEPAPVDASISGTEITVTFDNPLDPSQVPVNSQWNVNYDSVPQGIVGTDVPGGLTCVVHVAAPPDPLADVVLQYTRTGGGGGGGGGAPGNPFALIRLGGTLNGFTNLANYALVIVSADGVSGASPLPGRRLVYTNASGLESAYSEGLSYATASANGWLLGQASNGKWVVDHTNSALNTAMASAARDYAVSKGLDGLFLDDVVPKDPYGFTTPTGWRDGMVSFVSQLHTLLAAEGMYLLANVDAFTDPTLGNVNDGSGDVAWAELLTPDGMMTEHWQESRDGLNTLRSVGPAYNQLWDEWMTVPASIHAAGMDYVGVAYNTDWVYTFGSLLLAYTPTMQFAAGQGADNWDSSTWSRDPGAALEAKTLVGSVWRRRFTNYAVYVNPTTSTQTADGHTLAAVTALFV